jgi:hypothetical protein
VSTFRTGVAGALDERFGSSAALLLFVADRPRAGLLPEAFEDFAADGSSVFGVLIVTETVVLGGVRGTSTHDRKLLIGGCADLAAGTGAAAPRMLVQAVFAFATAADSVNWCCCSCCCC